MRGGGQLYNNSTIIVISDHSGWAFKDKDWERAEKERGYWLDRPMLMIKLKGEHRGFKNDNSPVEHIQTYTLLKHIAENGSNISERALMNIMHKDSRRVFIRQHTEDNATINYLDANRNVVRTKNVSIRARIPQELVPLKVAYHYITEKSNLYPDILAYNKQGKSVPYENIHGQGHRLVARVSEANKEYSLLLQFLIIVQAENKASAELSLSTADANVKKLVKLSKRQDVAESTFSGLGAVSLPVKSDQNGLITFYIDIPNCTAYLNELTLVERR
ncbi:hypothetical protein RsTz2092_08420 [Deferribacterales bacterium RsTz2092]|nr:hypothetical protein AGMMS49941_05720 [Deferribacterales bacterium]